MPNQTRDMLLIGNKGKKINCDENARIKEIGIKFNFFILGKRYRAVNPPINTKGNNTSIYLPTGLPSSQSNKDLCNIIELTWCFEITTRINPKDNKNKEVQVLIFLSFKLFLKKLILKIEKKTPDAKIRNPKSKIIHVKKERIPS